MYCRRQTLSVCSQRFGMSVTSACLVLGSGGCREDVGTTPVVLPAVPALVTVTPAEVVILNGETVQLTADVRDSTGVAVHGTLLEWSSFDSAVASVSNDGLVLGVRLGTARIRVAVGELADTADVSVRVLFRSVSAGVDHTCGISTTGLGYCWGRGAVGRLGDGQRKDSPGPIAVADVPQFSAIDAGFEFSCGHSPLGEAYCWGGNRSGQLGSGRKSDSSTPVAVAGGHTFQTVSASAVHACGIAADAQAYCWGGNWFGEGGHGWLGGTHAPLVVAGGIRFARLATGFFFTCAIADDLANAGRAFCWGENQYGQLGVQTAGMPCRTPTGQPVACAAQPTKVSRDIGFEQLSAGGRHACGVDANGTAYCWGDNALGQLGSATGSQSEPTPVFSTAPFIQVTAGDSHTCALTAEGDAYCWGSNASGELGSLSTFENCGGKLCSRQPVLVTGNHRFRMLRAGGSPSHGHSCGITTQDEAFCWGGNEYGQLGFGRAGGNSSEPVRVAGQPTNE